MSLVNLVVPIGKQYKFVSPKAVLECLNDLQARLKPAEKVPKKGPQFPLEGIIAKNSFVIYRNFHSSIRKSFTPEVHGILIPDEKGGTLIRVTSKANPTAASIINSSLSTLLGALIGLAITFLLVPNMVPRFYAFLWTAVIPFVVALLSALMARIYTAGDVKTVMSTLSTCFAAEHVADSETWANGDHPSTVSQQLMAGSLSCLLCVAIAYCTNSMIAGCWSRGQYDKVEAFCRPVAQISEAVLGPDNVVSAQSRYQLAESLRCQYPPKFREAETLYERSIESKDKSLKDNPVAIANNLFSLGRVYDQTGRHAEADKLYREAVEKWESAKEVGPDSVILARALDRLAMLSLKEHKYDDAEKFEKRALDIDRRSKDQDTRSVGEDLNDLALIYDQQEKYKEAENLYKEAMSYKDKHLNPTDYSRATTLYNLAEVEKLLGNQKQFADLSTQAYSVWKKLLRFKADYSPNPPKQSEAVESAAITIEAPSGQEVQVDNPRVVPDPISCYLRILKATREDYEAPHLDTRFDGMRPYLGRQ